MNPRNYPEWISITNLITSVLPTNEALGNKQRVLVVMVPNSTTGMSPLDTQKPIEIHYFVHLNFLTVFLDSDWILFNGMQYECK
jgi:hypothetical protein